MTMIRRTHPYRGFTLVELLIVVALIALLAIAAFIAFQHQSDHAYDTRKKSDLSKIRTAFEDYYNDHSCYPKKSDWENYNCKTGAGGDFLKAYLPKIPCDPQTNERYLYITEPQTSDAGCVGYHLLAALTVLTDPDIKASGCDPNPQKGCGFDPYKYNYGLAMGGPVANADFDFGAPVPTPTQTFPPGDIFCMASDTNIPHHCTTNGGLVSSVDKSKTCSDVLRADYSCYSFRTLGECASYCQKSFNTYKCVAPEGLCIMP